MKPLEGLKVVERARVLAGPWAGQALADLGAEVLKVESPAADDTRAWSPPFIERDGDRTAAYFYATNRGKSFVVADFAPPEGRAMVRGQKVDLALLDSAVALLANQAMNCLATGEAPARLRNAHPNLVVCEALPVEDGHVIVAVGNDRQFRAFAGQLGMEPLADNPIFATNAARVENRELLIGILGEATAAWDAEALLAALTAAGVPVGPINDIGAAFDDPQVAARGLKITPEGVPGVRAPWRFSDAELALDRTAPVLPGKG